MKKTTLENLLNELNYNITTTQRYFDHTKGFVRKIIATKGEYKLETLYTIKGRKSYEIETTLSYIDKPIILNSLSAKSRQSHSVKIDLDELILKYIRLITQEETINE